eukprot:scaffold34805_cov75-Phaeocystis_antarctica.AAC.2
MLRALLKTLCKSRPEPASNRATDLDPLIAARHARRPAPAGCSSRSSRRSRARLEYIGLQPGHIELQPTSHHRSE